MMRTEIYDLNQDLIFRDRADQPITIHGETLTLIWTEPSEASPANPEDKAGGECRLRLQVSPELYHQIDTEALFHLNPQLRGSFSKGEFLPEFNLHLEITLQPDVLPQLWAQARTAEAAAGYLMRLSSPPVETEVTPAISEPESLLNTENWICLTVKQIQDAGETGYSTFWQYVSPASLKQPEAFSEEIANGFVNFIQDEVQTNLSTVVQDVTTDLFDGVSNLFGQFEHWLDETLSDNNQKPAPPPSMLDTVIQFLVTEEWPYVELPGEATLRLSFRGDHGQWTCYARAREEQNQLVFYSLCPIQASEHQRSAIAELIARANYGIVLGNFELDFSDGEIRYKTSIDVGDDTLTVTLVKQLVYTNVLTMDHYLPAILAVLEGNQTPVAAITKVETEEDGFAV